MMVNNSELIKDFVNTLHKDPHGDEEELVTPEQLDSWLDAHALPTGPRAGAADLASAIELREALRVLLLANNGEDVDVAAAHAALDRDRARCPCRSCAGRTRGRYSSPLPPGSRERWGRSSSPFRLRSQTGRGSG